MALDFSSYLKVGMDDVPTRIPTLPAGHYFATIQGWKTATRNFGGDRSEVPVVELTFKITSSDDDVEDSNLVPANKTVRKDYVLNDPDKLGLIMLRRLAEDTCQLPTKGLELDGVLDALKGSEVKVYNEPRPGKEDGEFYDNIKKVLPAT